VEDLKYARRNKMKHIKDIEKAYDLLKQWNNVASRLCGEGLVALKEMERLKIQTKLLIEEEE
tara:strand:+ start:2651 stop:2836 length:186 start_codon:yes stop_codon:yes gene_type:complete